VRRLTLSSPVSLPVPSALDTDVPPIDETAGAMGRTAPTSSSKKGCGRADCCQLGDSKKPASTAPSVSFPRFQFKPYQPGTELIFPPSLVKHELLPLKFGSAVRQWLRPTTLEQLVAIKQAIPEAKLVGGSSEVAIEVGILGRQYPTCVYIADIPELYAVSTPVLTDAQPSLVFGANLPLSELEELCKALAKELPAAIVGPLNAIGAQLRYFAGRQIRNTASVGGNIATARFVSSAASRRPHPNAVSPYSPISDLNPVWMAVDAKVVAMSADRGEFELPLSTFFTGYRQTTLPPDAVIVKIVVPLNNTDEKEVVRAYKQARRKDDDISIVCACMVMRVSSEGTISRARLAYGGMAAFTVSAVKTQDFLVGPFVRHLTSS
jgi:xanthine dehydrogenase/oxidase